MTDNREQIAYSPLFKPLAVVVGMGPGRTEASVKAGLLRLRMGWAFNLEVPTDLVKSAAVVDDRKWWWGCGAHVIGRGRWIINGTLKNLVEIHFREPVTARTLGKRMAVSSVLVSVRDAGAFARQLTLDPPR